MSKTSQQRNPTFVWQALLILVPVMLLAIVGFFSLRQDKLLAEQEAQERAQAIADELRAQVWMALTNGGLVAGPPASLRFQVDNGGRLLFPPPVPPLPQPSPFRVSELNPEQARLWQQARTAETELNEPLEAAKSYSDFLSLGPPKEFAGAACFAVGLLLAKQGNAARAEDMFQRFTKDFADARGESGLPLRPLAELKLLELETNRPGAERRALLDSFCSNLVCYPMALTEHLLQMAPAPENLRGAKAIVAKWQRTWQDQEHERRLYAAACGHFGSGPPQFKWIDEAVEVPRYVAKRSLRFQPTSVSQAEVRMSADESNSPAPRLFWFATTEPWPSPTTNVFQPVGPGVRMAKGTNSIPLPTTIQQDWLAVRSGSSSAGWWLDCQTHSQMWRALTSLVGGHTHIPDYFGIVFRLDGALFVLDAWSLRLWSEHHYGGKGGGWEKEYSGEDASDRDLLASALLREAGREWLWANVYLTSPTTLYSRQSARTFWFSLLIVGSAAAALIGLITAWRVFGRQLKLNEMKSNFVSSVSHELRAPVASVRLMAESLERGKISETPKQHEYFRFIVQECRRLSSLVENVLDFSRIEQGGKEYEFEPTDLVVLTERTVKLMEPYAAERQVGLALAVPDSQLTTLNSQLLLDGKAIQQALVNLIDNAIKHSPKGGTVTVGLEGERGEGRGESEQTRVEYRVSSGEQHACATSSSLDPRPSTLVALFVEDRGEGIPLSEHEKIFERFYRRGSELRRETQGVGIGLSIVKHIVEAHGGKVRVRSAVGQGSTFTIELPADKGNEETTDGRR